VQNIIKYHIQHQRNSTAFYRWAGFLTKWTLLFDRETTAGCFTGLGENIAWLFQPGEVAAEQLQEYSTNAKEADSRIWHHAIQCQASNILIYFPDTNAYNIGLPFLSQLVSTTIIIKLNVPHANEKKYLNINMMRTALQKDSDLGNLCQEKPCRIFQTLFICIECDHVSYFKSMGKATILNVFFQYALFICGENMPGCLDSTSLHIREQGFLPLLD